MFKHIQKGNAIKSIIFLAVIFYLGKVFDPYNQGQLSVVLIYFIGILSISGIILLSIVGIVLLTLLRIISGYWTYSEPFFHTATS